MAEEVRQDDFVRELLEADEDHLRSYLEARLSGRGPFQPPLREPDESPRHFVENLMLYGKKADKPFFQRVEKILRKVLASYLDPDAMRRINEGGEEDKALFSHCLYLVGKFRLESCAPVVWGAYMSSISPSEAGPLGRIETLVADVAGIFHSRSPERSEAFWLSEFTVEKNMRRRITAFVNLYLVNAVSALGAAEELLREWAEGKMDESLRIAGILTRYLLHVVAGRARRRRVGALDVVGTMIASAYVTLPTPKLKALFAEMREFEELAQYVDCEVPVTLFGVSSEPETTKTALREIAERKKWAVGEVAKEPSEALLTESRGIAVCVVDAGKNRDRNGEGLGEIASFVYDGINRREATIMFLLNEKLWQDLGLSIRQTNRLEHKPSALTSIETSRIGCFASYQQLTEKVILSVGHGLKVTECLGNHDEISAGVLATASKNAIWHGDTLYNEVSNLFETVGDSHSSLLHRDCFLAVIRSLADREHRLSYKPATGLWGRRFQDIKIYAEDHVF
jgi:hypothetical protein